MKNKNIKVTHISERKTREIIRLFSLDIEAKQTAEITGMSRPSVNKLFDKIREQMSRDCELHSPLGKGEIELDESYFGAKRVRGAKGKNFYLWNA